MKKLFFLATASLILSSCSIGIKQVADVNMISNRNIDPKNDYELIQRYAGSNSKKELKKEVKKVKATNVQSAVDYTVRNIPGAEFLTNVKIFVANGKYFIVHGDAWGFKGAENTEVKGFRVGDNVQFKKAFQTFNGTITKLTAEKAHVKDDSGKVHEIDYDKLKAN